MASYVMKFVPNFVKVG